jgi:hypothetical protein
VGGVVKVGDQRKVAPKLTIEPISASARVPALLSRPGQDDQAEEIGSQIARLRYEVGRYVDCIMVIVISLRIS